MIFIYYTQSAIKRDGKSEKEKSRIWTLEQRSNASMKL